MSIEAQRDACRDYAAKNNLEIYRIYEDRAESATTDNRPAFQDMIGDALQKDHPFEAILCHKTDRFARNREDAVKYKYMLRRKGIKIVFVSQPINQTGHPTELLLEHILEDIDEFYSQNLALESIKGMLANAKAGYWNGGYPPFGYRTYSVNTDKGNKKRLEIVESEACIVREIFDLFLQGSGMTSIRNKLTTQGFKCRGGSSFSKNLISNILISEKYIGSITFGKKKNKRNHAGHFNFPAVTVENSHPPIIEKEKWAKVQEIISAREKLNESKTYYRDTDYIFSGILTCSCGAAMIGKSAHGRTNVHHYYVCNEKIRKGTCKAKDIPADKFEDWILQDLEKELTEPDKILRFINDYNSFVAGIKKTTGSNAKSIEAELKKIEQKRTRLFEAIEDGIGISKADIAPRLKELNALKETLLLELEKANRDSKLELIESTKNMVSDFSKCYRDLFSAEKIKESKTKCQSLVEKISISGDQAEILYNPNLGLKKKRFALNKPGEPIFTCANQNGLFKLVLNMALFWNNLHTKKCVGWKLPKV